MSATARPLPTKDFPDFGRDDDPTALAASPPGSPVTSGAVEVADPAPRTSAISREDIAAAGGGLLVRLSLSELHESPFNPRKFYDPAGLEELMDSLLAGGQLTAITVRPRWKQGGYEIGAGHRRLRAAKLACVHHPEGAAHRDLGALLAVVRDLDDRDFIALLNIENLQRKDLHAYEEAEGFATLMKEAGLSIEQISSRIGKSTRYVYDSLTLLKLTAEAKKLFLEGRFERSHAVELARLSPEWQKAAISERDDKIGRRGGLFEDEYFHADPTLPLRDQEKAEGAMKPVSVREFRTWVDDHVRAVPEAIDGFLFPQTAKQIEVERAKRKGKIVYITYDYRVPDAARDPKIRTFGEAAWKRADGLFKSKLCQFSVLGLVCAGPGRNEAFQVCVNKDKCRTHWPDYLKEKARRVKERARYAREDRDSGAVEDVPKAPKAQPYRFGDMPEDQDAIGAAVKQLTGGLAKRAQGIEDALKALPGDILWNFSLWLEPALEEVADWMPTGKRGNRWKNLGQNGDEVLQTLLPRGGALPKDLAGVRRELAAAIFLSRDFEPKKFEAEVEKLARILRAQGAKCEQCKCTEAKACPGGCAWDPAQLKKGHYVCTACTKKVATPAKAAAKKKPAAKKAKKR